jgi:hypothetical protein
MGTAAIKTIVTHNRLLEYLGTNLEAIIRFHASSMQLAIESDATYFSVSKTRSWAPGFFYLTSNQGLPSEGPYNGPIHVYCCVMKEGLVGENTNMTGKNVKAGSTIIFSDPPTVADGIDVTRNNISDQVAI